MCGIYGLVNFDQKPVPAEALRAMGRVTVHRGPDDEGMHLDGLCAIGMRRLSIIDVTGGHQPLRSADGSLWLVCNGEIYNYRELRAELEARGHTFLTHSDCEVILGLYREMGDAFMSRLNGMFGFALWDATRQRLVIGRDRLGIKPIYTLQDGNRFAFASEAKALLALPGASAALNEAALPQCPPARCFAVFKRKMRVCCLEIGTHTLCELLAHCNHPKVMVPQSSAHPSRRPPPSPPALRRQPPDRGR